MIAAPTSVEDLLALLEAEEQAEASGATDVVSALEHHLQCAALLATTNPDDPELQVAGLVHDLGHLVVPEDPDEHGRAGAYLLGPLLGPRVARLVELHVPAKRYLVAADPTYAQTLSETSTRTLELQGGPLSLAEIADFERAPEAADAVTLRWADEAAKVPGRAVPSLDRWHPLLAACCERAEA